MFRLGLIDLRYFAWTIHMFTIACISLSAQKTPPPPPGANILTQSVEYLKSLALIDRKLIRDLKEFKNTIEDNSSILVEINK